MSWLLSCFKAFDSGDKIGLEFAYLLPKVKGKGTYKPIIIFSNTTFGDQGKALPSFFEKFFFIHSS